jgi:outer membrane protein OmpA-like peptidoglycan-associated protein
LKQASINRQAPINAHQHGDQAVNASNFKSTTILRALRCGPIPSCALAVLLAACATNRPEDPALVQARDAVDKLQSDPLAQQVAGKPLQDARDSLAAAQAAARAHKPPEEVDHLAYLAKRHADMGEAVVDENRAHQQIAQAQAQRDAVLIAAREREAQAARAQAARAQADAQAAEAKNQATQHELSELQAKQTERGMVLTLGSNLLFDTGSDVLKPGADEALDRVSRFLQQHQGIDIRVEGHTDSVGSDSLNDALSERRANAVAHALESRGVDSGRVQAVGRGKQLPIATNETAAGRQQNRRVEIVFSDAKGQFVSAR